MNPEKRITIQQCVVSGWIVYRGGDDRIPCEAAAFSNSADLLKWLTPVLQVGDSEDNR